MDRRIRAERVMARQHATFGSSSGAVVIKMTQSEYLPEILVEDRKTAARSGSISMSRSRLTASSLLRFATTLLTQSEKMFFRTVWQTLAIYCFGISLAIGR